MTEKPLNFKGWEVNAALAGRKTMFRRVLKPQPIDLDIAVYIGGAFAHAASDGTHMSGQWKTYAPGDVLWLRETWQTGSTADGPQISFRSTPDFFKIDAWDGPDEGIGPSFNYARCPGADFHHWLGDVLNNDGPWRSPIHMPRWASRITLKVTGVKVQRLQDISEDDARAEGAPYDDGDMQFPSQKAPPGANYIEDGWDSARDWFTDTWNIIHGPGAWDANPWVAAYAFERVTG